MKVTRHNIYRAMVALLLIFCGALSIETSWAQTKTESESQHSEDQTILAAPPKAKEESAKSQAIMPPLQGFAKRDVKGTPIVPEWKMQAGYDEVLGKFYIGFLGFKLKAVNNPPSAAVMGARPLKHWKGYTPHPCFLKFIKLHDDSGGYYFQTIGSENGPRGWIIPQPSKPHEVRSWAIYFMQKADDSQSN